MNFHEAYEPVTESGCWIWMRGVDSYGYGQLAVNGKTRLAHRYSYELSCGEIQPGLCVLHKCDIPTCVNPAHLFLGTQADNMRDMARKGRSKLGRPHQKGVEHGGCKLTEDQVRAIRADTRSQSAIASKYGISQPQVGRIRRRERWRHIP